MNVIRSGAKTLEITAMDKCKGKKSEATLRLVGGLQDAGLMPRD
jgi:hypothetical protein